MRAIRGVFFPPHPIFVCTYVNALNSLLRAPRMELLITILLSATGGIDYAEGLGNPGMS